MSRIAQTSPHERPLDAVLDVAVTAALRAPSVLWGDRDGRRAWLTAGVALSRLLLTVADRGTP